MKRNLSLAIVHLMQSAQQHIQYPKIRLQATAHTDNDTPIQLSVAGERARHPGSVNITDGGSYGSSTFYGRIHKDGTLDFSPNAPTFRKMGIIHELELFADDPAGYAKLYSNGTGNCMFCAKALTDPQSVAVGYGPICADHYGLPHGEIDSKVAQDMTEVEFDLESLGPIDDAPVHKHDIPSMSNEDAIADLQLRVEQLEKLFKAYSLEL